MHTWNKITLQWEPSVKATLDGGLSKEVDCHENNISMICEEWCMDMDRILQI